MSKKKSDNKKDDSKGVCFVIMPISDPEGYAQGHFKSVYNDIFTPAIEKAGYTPHRADDKAGTSLIQLDIIQQLINAPMAICDLSNHNPNVLYELGVRQAFDMPTVLIQEDGTKRIFDISTLATLDYEKNLVYRNVLDSQNALAEAILATEKENKSSLIGLLGREAATVKPGAELSAEEVMGHLKALSRKVDKLDSVRSAELAEEFSLLSFSFTSSFSEQIQKAESLLDESKAEAAFKEYQTARLLVDTHFQGNPVPAAVLRQLMRLKKRIMSTEDSHMSSNVWGLA